VTSKQHSPSSEARDCSNSQDIIHNLAKLISLSYSQELAIGVYSQPHTVYPVHDLTCYFCIINFNIILPSSLTFRKFFLSGFPTDTLHVFPLSHAWYIPRLSHPPFHHPHYAWCGITSMKLLIMQLYRVSCYFLPPQHAILRKLQSRSSFNMTD
jgi:hypothetical protein